MNTGLVVALLSAATSVPGGTLTSSTTWTAAGSPYTLDGPLTVPAGMTLTLQAGTVVVPTSSASLTVQGTLIANGTAQSPVTIGDAQHEWRGLDVLGGTGTSLNHLTLNNTIWGMEVGVTLTATDLTIENPAYGFNGDCITVQAGSPTFTRLTARCYDSALVVNGGTVTVHDSVLDHDGSGVEIASNSTANVDHTVIRGGENGLKSAGMGTFSHVTITGTWLCAADFEGAPNMTLRDSIFVTSFQYGICGPLNGTIAFDHNDVHGAIHPLNVIDSDIGQDGNIAANPAFVSSVDVHLTSTSPCRGAGTNGSDLGAYGYSSSSGTAPASLSISPSSASVVAGATLSLAVTVRDTAGNVLATAPVSWSIASGGGSVGAGGTFTAPCTPGSVTVRASSGPITATATLTVTVGPAARLTISPANPTVVPGGTVQFSGSAQDQCGNGVSTPALTWSVSPAAGTFTASVLHATTNPGTYPGSITVASGGLSATTGLTVTSTTGVASLQVSPSALTLWPGQTAQLSVTARDAGGNTVSASPAYQVVLPAAGSISAGGLFTAATAAGTYHAAIRVTAGAASATVDVVVTAGPAQRIMVAPASLSLAPGGMSQLTASVVDAYGNPRADTVAFNMSVVAAGTVTTAGAFTASTVEGTYVGAVQARAAGLVGSIDVVVTSSALSRLLIFPETATVRVGDLVTFSVTAKDTHGSNIAVSPVWSVVRGGGTVSTAGVFKAGERADRFELTVQATARGLTATATVVVIAGPVATLTVDPVYPTVQSGEQLPFTAKAIDAYGNPTSADVQWSVDPIVGKIDYAGVFTAGHYNGNYADVVWATDPLTGVAAGASVRVVGGEDGVAPIGHQGSNTQVSSQGCAGCGAAPGLPLLLALLGLRRRARRS